MQFNVFLFKSPNMILCDIKMVNVIRILLYTLLLLIHGICKADPLDDAYMPCLTGNFTDVQNWIFENGTLNHLLNESISIDLSEDSQGVYKLRLVMQKDMWDVSDENCQEENNIFENDINMIDNTSDNNSLQISDLKKVVFLSLARNSLDRIPLFYSTNKGTNTVNFTQLRYLSFYGNNFGNQYSTKRTVNNYVIMINATEYNEIIPTNQDNFEGYSNWIGDLKNLVMPELLELDLRNCSIQILESDTFISLPSLRRLYLSFNNIYQISENAFKGLKNLIHLDLSHNTKPEEPVYSTAVIEGMTIAKGAFLSLIKLKSLDFSFSKIAQTCAQVFGQLGSTLERLSVCYTKFPSITKGMFAGTSLKHLDISGNIALEALGNEAFDGLEKSLEILFANRLGIKNMQWVANLTQLKILSMTENDITHLNPKHIVRLKNLQLIDLKNNRIINWNTPIFQSLKNLKMVRIAGNNLNLITHQMLKDFNKLDFLSLGNNSFVCNCLLKDFVARAIEIGTEMFGNESLSLNFEDNASCKDYIYNGQYLQASENILYQHAITFYSDIINNRFKKNTIIRNTKERKIFHDNRKKTRDNYDEEYDKHIPDFDEIFNFTMVLLDYIDQSDICTDSKTNNLSRYDDIICDNDNNYERNVMNKTSILIVSLIVVGISLLIVGIIFWKWWYIRYFFMMIKNAAILSVLGKEHGTDELEKVFTYDVFVSYCDEDRPWVLDQLLPEVENNANISVCLHERDFQVGLSILENIISCMDRSRALMMVVSKQFLLSQWCQFEMHLAQHRLMETRREQLILILLEDIPRRKRPNTLHYLMMTKTYIVWPQPPEDTAQFWKRLNKALLYGKTVAMERTSSA